MVFNVPNPLGRLIPLIVPANTWLVKAIVLLVIFVVATIVAAVTDWSLNIPLKVTAVPEMAALVIVLYDIFSPT